MREGYVLALVLVATANVSEFLERNCPKTRFFCLRLVICFSCLDQEEEDLFLLFIVLLAGAANWSGSGDAIYPR